MTFKEKIDNCWYYYKWHIIAGIFVLALVAVTIVQCAQKVNPDLSIAYIGYGLFHADEFEKDMSEVVGDVNGDGTPYVFCDNVTLPSHIESEMDVQIGQKVLVIFVDGSTKLFITNSDVLNEYADFFEDLSGILPDEKLEDAFEYEETKLAVSAKQCPMLEKYGLSGDDMYVGIRIADGKSDEEHDAAVKLIQAIAK